MLRRFRRDRRGASEIVGTALFLVILFFFFSNVFLWHDQVTREMDQVVVDRMNSGIRVENATVVEEGSLVVLKVTNVGGLDVRLSRLWIITDDYHLFADFENLTDSIRVEAGLQKRIVLSGPTDITGSKIKVSDDGETVYYDPPLGELMIFRILTKRANTAACSLELHTLTVTVDPIDSGIVSLYPNHTRYNYGDIVELWVVPNSGYVFVDWSGDVSGTRLTTTVKMIGDMNVTATFIPEE